MPAKRTRRRRGGGRGAAAEPQHTSVPTGRAAYTETRRWLLDQHGPICAYCGVKWPPRTMTLDHVTPRRGQSAYDRRDNLVLACRRCNEIKADKPFLAFLLGQRARAVNLLRFGEHLSEGILDLCRQLAGDAAKAAGTTDSSGRIIYGVVYDEDNESPYAGEHTAKPAARGRAGGGRAGGGRSGRGGRGGGSSGSGGKGGSGAKGSGGTSGAGRTSGGSATRRGGRGRR